MEMNFGQYIRQLRKNNHYTLTKLAAELGLDSANLSKIENGKREFDEKRLLKLAELFKLNIEEVKAQYFSDLFAKKMIENKCPIEALRITKNKVTHLMNKL